MKTKSKKKSVFMLMATAMAVVTMLSVCAISGTFAKYVTTAGGTATARVAYWGFSSSTSVTFDLFDVQDSNVKSSNSDKVIAPGMSAEKEVAFSYASNAAKSINAPEVAYKFTVSAEATGDYSVLDSNKNFKWTLKQGSDAATEYDTVAELLTAIKQLSGESLGTKTYNAGQLPTMASGAYKIGWKWAFSADTDGDVADTAMGNATTLDNITLKIGITAEQID